jgi:hypothetical protein
MKIIDIISTEHINDHIRYWTLIERHKIRVSDKCVCFRYLKVHEYTKRTVNVLGGLVIFKKL